MKFLYESFLDRPDLTFLEEFHWNGIEKIHKTAGMLAVIHSSEYLPKRYSVIKSNLKMRTGEFTKIVDSRFIWSLVLNWFLTDEDFFNKVGLYSDRIDHFKKIVKRPSRNLCYKWASIYFKYFENIRDIQVLNDYLSEAFKRIRITKNTIDEIKIWKEKSNDIFVKNSIGNLCDLAKEDHERGFKETLQGIKKEYSIPEGSYLRIMSYYFYIREIKKLKPKENGDKLRTLDEFIDNGIFRKELGGAWSFGNEAVRIMISKLIKDSPPDFVWIKKILEMFGDPRNEEYDRAGYNKTWGRMSRDEVLQMRRWLVHLDFEIFIMAVDFEKERKEFVQKILDEKTVVRSRIIIDSPEKERLRKVVIEQNLKNIDFAILKEQADRSLIYIEILDENKNSLHLIEGTKGTSLNLFRKEPANRICEKKEFDIRTILSEPLSRISHKQNWEREFYRVVREKGFIF